MAEWSRNRANPSDINGNREFTTNDNLSVKELNAIVNNSFYGVDFVEAITETPDTSEANNVGTPSVSFVDNGKFKRLKFSNLKGATGERGNGISYIEESASVGNTTGYRIHFDNGTYFDYEVVNGNGIRSITSRRNPVNTLETEYTITFDDLTTYIFWVRDGAKGEKGDKGDSPTIAQTTGTSTTAVMSQDAVTKEITALNSKIPTFSLDGTTLTITL